MTIENAIVILLDVETTGTRKGYDQIIELSARQGFDANSSQITLSFKPTVPISAGAYQVHGIRMDDLDECEPFSAHAQKIRRIFEEADVIVAYNASFDIDMLQAELQRVGLRPIDLSKKLIIDPYRLWQQMEPRTLQDAHRRFVGTEFDEAHSAEADNAATARVLQAMLEEFELSNESWEEIADVCEPERRNWIGASHHIQWDEGVPVIAFGKHAGTPLHVLASGPDSSYLEWMMDRDFPEHVKRICASALRYREDSLIAWIRRDFGPPPDFGFGEIM